jgi:hypothetical protein
MNILEKIKNRLNFFRVEKDLEDNLYFKIREDSFFLNSAHHKTYLEKGYCVVKNVVHQEEIARFLNVFEEISKLEGFELDKHLLNSGRLFNPG